MIRNIIIHLHTKDVPAAKAFYTALGFGVNEEISGEKCVCLVMNDTISVMLSEISAFATFSPRGICDTSKYLEVLNCVTCDSREEVDEMIRKALANGGTVFEEAEDHGFMYAHSFLDPDGHGWNLMYFPETAGAVA